VVLRFAAENPDSARLLLVDPWEHDKEGADRREGLLNHFAALLASGREQAIGASAVPALADEFLVGAVAAVIGDRLGVERERGFSRHPALAAELSEYVLLPYLGRTRARVWAHLRSAERPRLLADDDLIWTSICQAPSTDRDRKRSVSDGSAPGPGREIDGCQSDNAGVFCPRALASSPASAI
jgi:hypothetical protein